MNDETEVRKDSWLRRNPPHPGESIREGCMRGVDYRRGCAQAGSLAEHAVAGAEWPVWYLARDGPDAGSRGLVQRGVPDAATEPLRPGASAEAVGSEDQSGAATHGLRPVGIRFRFLAAPSDPPRQLASGRPDTAPELRGRGGVLLAVDDAP